MDAQEPVTVFESLNSAEAEIIRGMLDAEGIRSQVTGAEQGGFTGVIPEVTLVVRAEDADRARELIAEHRATVEEMDDEAEAATRTDD